MRNWIKLFENINASRFYHVTEQESSPDILQNGFIGGWGDVGFGVYLYDNIYDAQNYAKKGGWDSALENPVIIEVQADDVERVDNLDADWDASLYENMWWYDMEDQQDDEDARWKPIMRIL